MASVFSFNCKVLFPHYHISFIITFKEILHQKFSSTFINAQTYIYLLLRHQGAVGAIDVLKCYLFYDEA